MDPEILMSQGAESIGQIASSAIGYDTSMKQMQFQEYMSDTAHTREVADLERAGLNPILSATGGNGASTPQGTQFTPGNPLQGLTQNVLASRMNRAQTNLMDNQSDTEDTKQTQNISSANLADAQADTEVTKQFANNSTGSKAISDALLNVTAARKFEQDILTGRSAADTNNATAANLRLRNRQTEAETDLYDTSKHPILGKILPVLNALHDPANSASNILKNIIP